MAKSAELVPCGDKGCFSLKGDLTFSTVPALHKTLDKTLNGFENIEINLSQVGRSDSAGLALLIELASMAKQRNSGIEFLNIPYQMLDIARVSRLDSVLSIYREG